MWFDSFNAGFGDLIAVDEAHTRVYVASQDGIHIINATSGEETEFINNGAFLPTIPTAGISALVATSSVLIVGCATCGSSGRVYVFRDNNGVFVQEYTEIGNTEPIGRVLMADNNNRVMWVRSNNPSHHIFIRERQSDGTWTVNTQIITQTADGGPQELCGVAMVAGDGFLVSGCPYTLDGVVDVWRYTNTTGQYEFVQRIVSIDDDMCGSTVFVTTTHLLVTCGTTVGKIYRYTWSNDEQKFVDPEHVRQTSSPESVSIGGGNDIVISVDWNGGEVAAFQQLPIIGTWFKTDSVFLNHQDRAGFDVVKVLDGVVVYFGEPSNSSVHRIRVDSLQAPTRPTPIPSRDLKHLFVIIGMVGGVLFALCLFAGVFLTVYHRRGKRFSVEVVDTVTTVQPPRPIPDIVEAKRGRILRAWEMQSMTSQQSAATATTTASEMWH